MEAVDLDNDMDVCIVPEHLVGEPRLPLEAELEDVQELKRQRVLENQSRRMILRAPNERHSPKRFDDFHMYASFCKRKLSTILHLNWTSNQDGMSKR
ncbi:hypothetical protein PHMEG_00026003 [Phytophthora megakarya]|uniref:Uncharacterized protein n=1 Tax=Phytophthora megakarya TaxID=4795 RepID=A0A225V9M5_9STRA|nr:hypothetical protein PHMEG_00026003 [Phytophthora megakarya]